jgi:dynein light chain Tctex-type 1
MEPCLYSVDFEFGDESRDLYSIPYELSEPGIFRRPMAQSDIREVALAAMQSVTQSVLEKCIDGKDYDEGNAESWCTAIVSEILQLLKPGRTPQYKFIASCMILSRRSQHVNETQIALWDLNKDLRITTKWSNETMQCIVSVWAFKTRFS